MKQKITKQKILSYIKFVVDGATISGIFKNLKVKKNYQNLLKIQGFIDELIEERKIRCGFYLTKSEKGIEYFSN